MTEAPRKKNGLEYGRGPGQGGYDNIVEALNAKATRIHIILARAAEHIAIVQVYGPDGTCSTNGEPRRNIVAMYDWIGDLKSELQALEEIGLPLIVDFQHERMRDIEGMLGIIADEHGGAQAVLKILREAGGCESVRDLRSANWRDVYFACEAILNTDKGSSDGRHIFEEAAAEVTSDFAKSAGMPVSRYKKPPTINQRRQQTVTALQALKAARGPLVVEMLIGVPQTAHGPLSTGMVLNGNDVAAWEQIRADANALRGAKIVEEDDQI